MQEDLKLLLKTSSEVAKEKDTKTVLVKFSEVTKKILGADRCSIFLHDKKTKELYTYIADGVREIRIPDNKGFAGEAFQENKIINIDDAYKDKRFHGKIDKETNYKTKSILTAPLHERGGKAIGVFQIVNKLKEEKFNDLDIEALEYISSYISAIVENFKLYEDIKKAEEELVYKLSSVTKYKDPETQNHIIRVGEYCAVLGRAMGWSKGRCELIRLAAPMHDIGKVGVPDRILLKPASLDDEEWDVMKKHPEFGYDILKNSNSELVEIAALVAYEHHEKWDGKGYPKGKKGEEISIYARMLSLVDVFDALSSKRHYKKSWELNEVLELIKDEKGKQFDPKLVDLFMANVDEILEIQKKYLD